MLYLSTKIENGIKLKLWRIKLDKILVTGITGQDGSYLAEYLLSKGHEVRKLGSGYHYGEWWGHKIQRGYGLKHRVFSLFQTRCKELPQCVNTVPCLGQTNFSDLKNTIQNLWLEKMSWCAKEQGVDYESCEGFIVLSALTGIRYKVVF